MQIKHKFYLGQKVKTSFRNKEIVARVLEIKIRTKGFYNRQIADDEAMPAYRIEGVLQHFMEDKLEAA